jgi:hypothetical protein
MVHAIPVVWRLVDSVQDRFWQLEVGRKVVHMMDMAGMGRNECGKVAPPRCKKAFLICTM